MKVGDVVRLKGKKTTATIEIMLSDIKGGVVVSPELAGCRYWNIDDLEKVKESSNGR